MPDKPYPTEETEIELELWDNEGYKSQMNGQIRLNRDFIPFLLTAFQMGYDRLLLTVPDRPDKEE